MSDGNKLVKYAISVDIKDQDKWRVVVASDMLIYKAYEES